MFEGEKTKKFLKIGLISAVVLILIFFLIKIFILKPPLPPDIPSSPPKEAKEVVIKYFSLEQEKNRRESEKYLFSDFTKVEIFGKNYQNLKIFYWTQLEEKEGSLPEYQIKDSLIKENEANITVEVITNRMENSLFFNFFLPEKIIFEVNLVKEGDYWKIVKINSLDLISKRNYREKVEIKENIFIKLISINYDLPKKIKPSEEGNKVLFLEIEFENKSTELFGFSSLNEWRVVDKDKDFYYPIPDPTIVSEKIILPDIKLEPNTIERSNIFFEVSEDFLVKEVIFQNQYKENIFTID
jgi:hypothetical protein